MEDSMYILSAGLEFFFALISFILFIGCLFDSNRDRKSNRILMTILLVHVVLNCVDACVWIWCDVPSLLPLMKVLTFLSYTLAAVNIALFSYLLVIYIQEYAPIPSWVTKVLCLTGILMVLLHFVSIFNGMYYYWDEYGICNNGNWHWLSQVFGIAFYVFDICIVCKNHKVLSKKDTTILILYSVIPLISFLFVMYWDVTPFYMAITIVLLLYYIIIHVEHGQRLAEQETKLIKQELELTNSRTAVVLTQVQPHFLYNSLTAIAQLCEKDPAKAKETTLNFSNYLRMNMNSLDQRSPVSFEQELEHVKTYLEIEQIRFGDDLHVVYNIQATDFSLPPLTLQPIVENAVKHGVGMKEDGGTVTISSKEIKDFYEVTVTDDGVGFDKNQQIVNNKKHIGMRLVRIRLEKLVGGTMNVESHPGSGTTVTICIPKRRDDYENYSS